jgi:DNA polymerase-3 subunit alpha
MAEFAEYGFNKSHSTAYAVISYQTAWLKANHPLEYMAALLTSQKTDTEKLAMYILETQAMGIALLPPDVNFSGSNFTVENGAIRYGLSAVKGIGEAAAAAIIAARASKDFFHDLTEFCATADLRTASRRILEALVNAGAFASTGRPRSALFAEIDDAVSKGSALQDDAASGQYNFFSDFEAPKPKPSAQDKDKKKHKAAAAVIEEWPADKLLSLEKELLGTYITGHPLAKYKSTFTKLGLVSSKKHAGIALNETFATGGILRNVQERLTKGGKPFAIITLEDFDGEYDLFLFSATYKKFQPLLIAGTALCIYIQTARQEEQKRVQFNVREIQLLDKLLRRDLHIALHPQTGEDELLALREHILAQKYKGDARVYFHIEDEDQTTIVRAGSSIRVAPSEELTACLSALPCVDEVFLGKRALRKVFLDTCCLRQKRVRLRENSLRLGERQKTWLDFLLMKHTLLGSLCAQGEVFF